jgi:tetratricopeptide (TPR) repeat protein
MIGKYKFISYLAILILLLTFYSCSKQKGVEDIISQADNIVEQQPDSALRLLKTILFPEDLDKNRFYKYNLLLVQAKDKNNKDITSDTLIFAARDYYIQKKDYPNAALAGFYCGRALHEQKNVEEAINAYLQAKELADKTGDYNLMGLIQGNLGVFYRENLMYDKAIALNKNAIVMYDKVKNYKNKISALNLIGDCFVLSNKIDSASHYYNESLKFADSCNISELQSNIRQSIGVTYRQKGNYEQAKKLFNEALTFSNDSMEQARILLNIAQVYVIEDNMDSVNFYIDKASALEISNPRLMRTMYLLRSKIEEKDKRYQESLDYYKEYHRFTMEVFDSEKSNKLLEIQEKYDFERLRNSQKGTDLKYQKILTVLLFILLVAGIIIFAYYRKSTQNKRILLETEQKIIDLQKMVDNFSKESDTFHNILLQQFGILRKTALMETVLCESEQISGQKLLKKFNEIVYGQDTLDWDKLYQIINNLKNGLYSKIRSKYPQLNEIEFRICCLSCETDFTDKEIGIVLKTTLNMVRRIRSDLRKKIGMSKGEDFLAFFESVIR